MLPPPLIERVASTHDISLSLVPFIKIDNGHLVTMTLLTKSPMIPLTSGVGITKNAIQRSTGGVYFFSHNLGTLKNQLQLRLYSHWFVGLLHLVYIQNIQHEDKDRNTNNQAPDAEEMLRQNQHDKGVEHR